MNPPACDRVVLHVGRHKSGTSSLQRMLADSTAALAAAGATYPQVGRRGVAHHPIADAFVEKTYATQEGAQAAQTRIADWRARIAPLPGTLIISSEAFQNVMRPARIAALFDPGRTDVVVYVRDHYSYAQSAYAQVVHAQRWTGSFADYLAAFDPRYEAFLRRWRDDYRPRALHVRAFDRTRLRGGDIIDDFLEVAGLPGDDVVRPEQDQNPSIGGALLEFKRVLNTLETLPQTFGVKGYGALSGVAALAPAFRVKPGVSPEAVAAYRARFTEEVTRIATAYPALGTSLSGRPTEQAPPMFGREDFTAVWAALLQTSPEVARTARRALRDSASADPMRRLILAAHPYRALR